MTNEKQSGLGGIVAVNALPLTQKWEESVVRTRSKLPTIEENVRQRCLRSMIPAAQGSFGKICRRICPFVIGFETTTREQIRVELQNHTMMATLGQFEK